MDIRGLLQGERYIYLYLYLLFPFHQLLVTEDRKLHFPSVSTVLKSLNSKQNRQTDRQTHVWIYVRLPACVAYGREKGVYRVLVGKPEGKRPLGRPRRRWVDNIRTDLQDVGCGYMDWIGLAQDRDRWRTLVTAVMNLRVPWNAGNFLTRYKPVSFSRRSLHRGVSE